MSEKNDIIIKQLNQIRDVYHRYTNGSEICTDNIVKDIIR